MIIYPSYFNIKLTRRQGRAVSKNLAFVPDPDKIEYVLKKLNLKYERQEKKYPRRWWEDKVRFYIETDRKKSEILKEIAKEFKKI